jgi:flavin-dependent dehydrogenase
VNEQNIDFIRACQWTVPLKSHLESIHIWFDHRLAGGYGWLFPKRDKANVGVGVDPRFGLKPAQELKCFASALAKMKLIEPRILATAGGLIPVGGPLTSRKGNLLLAGDAAGHCHPMTGAGVTTAVQCGELAGKAAARAALSGDFSNLDSYKSEVEELAGDMLRRALQARRLLEPFWAGPQLREVLRYSWVSFPEYGHAELRFTFADRP